MIDRDQVKGIYVFTVLAIVLTSFVLYGLNFGDYKEGSKVCSYQYNDPFTNHVELLYWKQYDLCCHFTLDDSYNIIEECL